MAGRSRGENDPQTRRRSAIGYVASTPGVLYWAENSTIKDGWPGPFVLLARNSSRGYRGNFIKFEFLRDL